MGGQRSLRPSRLYFALNLVLNDVNHGSFGEIEICAKAISAVDGAKLEVTYNAKDTTGSSAYFKPQAAREFDQIHSADTCTLKTLLKESIVDMVDFMKLDCEGCEFGVVASSSNQTLDQIKYVAGEIHPWMESQFSQKSVQITR